MDELNQTALEALAVILRDQDLPVQVVADSGVRAVLVGLETNPLLVSATVLETPPDTSAQIVPVGIEVRFDSSERGIYDTVVGLAEDRKVAVVEAVQLWSNTVFTVIRSAFGDEVPPNTGVQNFSLALEDEESGAVTQWMLTLGPAHLRGTNASLFAREIEGGQWVELLIDALTPLTRDEDLHWIKVYIAMQPNGSIFAECRFDNEEWPDAARVLQSVAWPTVEGFVQFRQFLVLSPV